jgi:uncharacterized protein YndB with AHSA1/START domain
MTDDTNVTVELPDDERVVIRRRFDAAPESLYEAYTRAELIERWWAPASRGEMISAEVDLRVGGSWRFAMRANGGFEVAFRGEYLELVPGERIVTTEVFEGMPDVTATTTTTFEADGEGTLLTTVVRHGNRAARDAHIASGMESGMRESFAQLEVVALGQAAV